MKIQRGTLLKLSIGIAISVICLVLALRGIDIASLVKIFKTVNIPYVILFLSILTFTTFLRSLIYYRFLKRLGKVSLFSMFEGLTIGYMVNSLFPLRAGDVVKAYIIGKINNVSKTYTFTLVIIERLFDMINLFFTFLLLLCILDVGEQYRAAARILAALIAGAIAFIIFTIRCGDRVSKLIDLAGFLIPAGIRDKVRQKISTVQEGFKVLCGWRDILFIEAIFLFCYLGYIAVSYVTGLSVGMKMDLPMILMLLVTVATGTGISASPGGLGVHQYACVLVFSYFHISREMALSFSLIQNTLSFALPIVMGWFFLIHTNMSLTSLPALELDTGDTKEKEEA